MYQGYHWQLVSPSFLCSTVFQFPGKFEILIFFSFSFNLTLWSTGTAKSTICQVLFFLWIIARSGHLAEIKWSVYISKSHRSLCVSFSWTDVGLCMYHFFVGLNLNVLHNSQWMTWPFQSCLVLYSFFANLLHSLIMRLIVSSLQPLHVPLLFCCVLSITSLI